MQQTTTATTKPRPHVITRRVQSNDPTRTIIRLKTLQTMVQISYTTIKKLMAQGEFPIAVRIGSRSIGWIKAEVDAWIDERKRQRIEQ